MPTRAMTKETARTELRQDVQSSAPRAGKLSKRASNPKGSETGDQAPRDTTIDQLRSRHLRRSYRAGSWGDPL